MVPATAPHYQSSGPSSTIPPPPIPRPPPHGRPTSSGPMHPGQSMGGPYGHPAHRPQHNPGMPSFPSQSPNPRSMPPPSGAAPPYHHPLHSPPNQARQPPHHMAPRGHMPHHSMPSHHQPPPQTYPPQPHPRQPQSGPPQPGSRQHRPSQKPKHPSSGLNGNWQSDKDMDHRREMIQHIVQLLKQKDQHASKEWLNKLPQMVKQLEVSLYRSAPSFEAYRDLSTLKHRLQRLAIEIAKTTPPGDERKNPPASRKSPHESISDRNDPEYQMKIRHKQQRLLLLHHSSKCQQGESCTKSPYCADMKRLWKHMSECSDTNCRVKHCYSSRSILRHYRMCKDPRCEVCEPVRESVRKSKNNNRGGGMKNGSSYQNDQRYSNRGFDQQKKHPLDTMPDPIGPPPGGPSMGSYVGDQRPPSQSGISSSQYYDRRYDSSNRPGSSASHVSGSHSPALNIYDRDTSSIKSSDNNSQYSHNKQNSSSNDRNDSGIKHKRQRLLLLRHASKCTVEGECKYTPHCANMKRIWKHISDCKQQNCKFSHCLSSRYLLSHYRRCKSSECPVCEPVRKVIRDSQAREKMKQQQGMKRTPDTMPPNHPLMQDRHPYSREPSREDTLPPPMFYDKEPPNKKARTTNDFPPMDNTSPHRGLDTSTDLSPGISPSDLSPPNLTHPEDPMVCQPTDMKIEVPQSMLSSVPSLNPTIPNNESIAPKPTPSSLPTKPPEVPHIKAPIPDTATSKNNSTQPPTPVTPKSTEENNYSLIHSFTVEQIQTHIDSLRTQIPISKLKSRCLEILKGLQTSQHGWVFNTPVDPDELGLPDYFDIIKKPMDLGTIQKKIDGGSYHNLTDFCNDVRLVFDNAMRYNEQGSVVHGMANELQTKFTADYDKLQEQLKIEGEERRKNGKACKFCGCEKLLFEPPVFFCNGMNCQSQRIRRNSHYYVGGNNQYYWCNQCYSDLDENANIEMADLTLRKSDLTKKKNDEVHEESWVLCDTCDSWIHQICGLFNSRQNKDKAEYSCPSCLLEKKKKAVETRKVQDKVPSADDLPRTKLSEWLENHVRIKVDEHRTTLAKEKSESEHMNIDEAMKAVNVGGPITIRQVTSTDRKLEVRERMKKRYAHKNYPSEFPFRCKCIVVFQNLDGVDVILFALYVYEHGEDNPPPNQRTVYISYLDSVHFMRPRKLRTFVYHEILIAYLDYARRKGFATAHIWACPPLKGDDYIFYAKPEDQKTPKDGRLRQWYIDMLIECQKRDIVGKMTNMHDLYFSNPAIDATAVPYLEGDYFPGEAENIIKDLEEGRTGKSGTSGKKSKKKKNSSNGNSGNNKSKSKSKTGRKGTRSAGIENESETPQISGDSKETSVGEVIKDPVMEKLGEIISPMKESFIVAYLNWSGARPEDMVVPENILNCRANIKVEADSTMSFNHTENGTFIGSTKKRDIEGKPRVVSYDSISSRENTDKNGNPLKIIDDDLEELDCEFFNNRQAFLNLCRGNHYQFDELRRAKHTSMMVLWHLHNRHADKFIQQCSSCSREILSGLRYHCNTCPGFDLCQDCYKNPKSNRGSCTHQLQAIPVDGESKGAKGGSGSQLTEEQRKDRQRNIKLHIQLIEHASSCVNPKCTSSNCAKMKQYLNHTSICKLKATGGCKICKRIWTLLRIHAQGCKKNPCPIPQCMIFRERLRQLAKQQQAMDDRRRQEMNRNYRMNANA